MPVFFLQRLDPATGSAFSEARIEIEDTARLAAALEIEDGMGQAGATSNLPP